MMRGSVEAQERQREHHKKYYQEHKNDIEFRKARKQYYEKNKVRLRKIRKLYARKIRKQAEEVLGGLCFICGAKRPLCGHKKDGSSHASNIAPLILKNPDEFVLLCPSCHRGIHFCMKILNMTWDAFLKEYKSREVCHDSGKR